MLAVDTSTDTLACAVAEIDLAAGAPSGVRMLASSDHSCRRQANVELVGSCLDALSAAGVDMRDVDAVLTGRGPGSFTGVRIGVATAKGLACGLGCPLYGTSALDATAWAAWAGGVRGKLAVVNDAMRHEVYPGIYELSDEGCRRTFETETVVKADVCAKAFSERADVGNLALCGTALLKYRDLFESAGMSVVDETLWAPTGEGLLCAWAAGPHNSDRDSGDPALVLPIYTRLSDAEENERRRLGQEAPEATSTGVNDALAGTHLQLRPMSINDVSQMVDLEACAYATAAHTPWSHQMFLDEFEQPGRSWWVAHDEGRIVGFAGGMMAGGDLEILDVVVDPARRRSGIASRLMARVAYDAQMLNAETISLEVEAKNAAAIALYTSLGMSECGRRRDYYGRGHDALIMAANLPLVPSEARVGVRPEPRASIRPWPLEVPERTADEIARLDEAGELLLAIESSCDETAMAVVDGAGRVISSVVATQIDFHARFGGVVPEIASRKHVEAIVGVYEEAMDKAACALGVRSLAASDLAGVGVTFGPGLVGALVVGVAFAKGLAAAADLPLVGINHLEGHLFANLFETPDLKPPFVASLVSGGNTMLVHVRDWGDYKVLGATIDDAVGEAFDKVAKALGLGYPGGPVISRLAEKGNPRAIRFPRALLHSHGYDFSLSGLKTSVITYIEGERRAGRPIDLPDLCASFEAAVVDVQVSKAVAAVEETGVKDFCVGGGVAANPALREAYAREFGRLGVRVTTPPLAACTDNAAMIALVARRRFDGGERAELTLDANPNLRLDATTCA